MEIHSAGLFLWANVYMLIIFTVNTSIGSDYLMINGKPVTPSFLDLYLPGLTI